MIKIIYEEQKNKGSRLDPCGTSGVVIYAVDLKPLYSTYYSLKIRWDKIIFWAGTNRQNCLIYSGT